MRGAIIDLDGTVYVGGVVVDGVDAGLQALREAGYAILFFSNNPVMDETTYVSHLQNMGVDARPGETCSSGTATIEVLTERHPDEAILCLGADSVCEQLRDAGLVVTDDPDECEVLLASWDPQFNYESMRRALVAADEETPFYGTDPDRTFQVSGDELVPGSGAVIGAVAATIGREPDDIFGKPSTTAQRVALDRLGVPPDECLIIGDRLDTDLEMGRRAGMTTVLVLTGVTDRAAVERASFDPDYIIDDIGDIDQVIADLSA